MPVGNAAIVVRLAAKINPPSIKGYRFTVQPNMYFRKIDHASKALSFPQLMLSPIDLSRAQLPCESATHTLLDCRGREAFKCRVVHSTEGLVSAVEISIHVFVVASAHTINCDILPEKESIEDDQNMRLSESSERRESHAHP